MASDITYEMDTTTGLLSYFYKEEHLVGRRQYDVPVDFGNLIIVAFIFSLMASAIHFMLSLVGIMMITPPVLAGTLM